jgi:hypothetical protein
MQLREIRLQYYGTGIDTGTLTLTALYNSSVVNGKAATILLEEYLKVLRTVTSEGSQRPIAES